MQQLGYEPADPWFEIGGWRLGVQVTTFENTYGLDPDAVVTSEVDGRARITCSRLTWAGGQERAEGRVEIETAPTPDGLEVVVSARHAQKIRSVTLQVSGLPARELIGGSWARSPVAEDGSLLVYPPMLHTPLVFLAPNDGPHLYFQSLDERVRAKRFVFLRRADAVTAELIFEEAAHEMSDSIRTPPWRLGRCADPSAVVERHMAHVERAYGLEAWESRADVPAWARKIALVATLHGMHWTGYVFNTYESMLRALSWIAERIEGRGVLAYLPGWEGRYYWQYGDYRPEPRLGGEEGFRRLVQGARELGVKLMPMFGMNCANSGLPGFEEWGASSVMCSASGLEFQGNRPDWDVSRSHDPGWQKWLNPGAPGWRDRLVGQVSALVDRYDLPAVFFDTQHVWVNDPEHPVFEGIVAVRDALKRRFPDLLVTGEGWYDALGSATPVSHVGAPGRWPEIFSKHCRTFLHVSAGDPSRGSTGVHELGHRDFRLAPDEPYWWPTLPVVDGTIERASERAEKVVAQARRYAEEYLS
jgi:hypothetical protein